MQDRQQVVLCQMLPFHCRLVHQRDRRWQEEHVFEHSEFSRVGISAAGYLTAGDEESSNRGRHPDRYNCLQWIALVFCRPDSGGGVPRDFEGIDRSMMKRML